MLSSALCSVFASDSTYKLHLVWCRFCCDRRNRQVDPDPTQGGEPWFRTNLFAGLQSQRTEHWGSRLWHVTSHLAGRALPRRVWENPVRQHKIEDIHFLQSLRQSNIPDKFLPQPTQRQFVTHNLSPNHIHNGFLQDPRQARQGYPRPRPYRYDYILPASAAASSKPRRSVRQLFFRTSTRPNDEEADVVMEIPLPCPNFQRR